MTILRTEWYCARADIETRFGKRNVAKWADLDNEGVAADITARIETACQQATAQVDDYLRESMYTVPLRTSGRAEVPEAITDVAAILAGCWLYESRGIEEGADGRGGGDKLLNVRTRAQDTLRAIRAGVLALNCDRAGTNIPAVVDWVTEEE